MGSPRQIDTGDDERPGTFIHDESIRASNGSSISSVKKFVKSNKDAIFFVVLLAFAVALGFSVAAIRHYEEKYESSARELADENRLARNHADQLKEEIRAAELAATILGRCKP